MIKVDGISFSRGSHKIFRDFNAIIPDSGITLLVGENGAGKTTLINLIGGALKLESGKISINGEDIAHLNSRAQYRLRAISPQRRVFELPFTADELLSIIPQEVRASHAIQVLESLRIEELAQKKMTQLSLGQQQRVNLALALIQTAPYYLLDEPVSALDLQSVDEVLELLNSLSRNHGILLVAHGIELNQCGDLGRVLSIRTDVR